MKKFLKFSLLVLAMGVSFAQMTPEQKKQMEEAQKKAAEAQKKIEEMMNNPEMKKMMEQMKKQDALYEAERKKKQKAQKKKQNQSNKKRLDEYYWKGKVASNTSGKFSNWKHGAVDLAYQLEVDNYLILGSIDANGQVNLSLPNQVTTKRTISTALIPEMHEVSGKDVSFSNPNTSFLSPGFSMVVLKGNKNLGNLYMGNSERVTYNLAAPCCLFHGDEGYRLYWAYSQEASTAQLEKIYNKDLYNNATDTKTQIKQTLRYDMKFKSGWNLIKSEVRGSYDDGMRGTYKDKIHTVVPSMPADAKYYFLIKDWYKL